VAVLDQRRKNDGSPNLNNESYIRISSQFLHDDLTYIRAHPRTYLKEVGKASNLFFVPSEQYAFLLQNSSHIAWYESWYNTWVDWQIHPLDLAQNPHAALHPKADQVSIQSLLTFGFTIVGIPLLLWRRRSVRSLTVALSFVWLSAAYVLLASVLLDFAENQRFRYDLGPLPLFATAAVLSALFAGRSRRFDGPRSDGPVALPEGSGPDSGDAMLPGWDRI
jgi:hypothetical protein